MSSCWTLNFPATTLVIESWTRSWFSTNNICKTGYNFLVAKVNLEITSHYDYSFSKWLSHKIRQFWDVCFCCIRIFIFKTKQNILICNHHATQSFATTGLSGPVESNNLYIPCVTNSGPKLPFLLLRLTTDEHKLFIESESFKNKQLVIYRRPPCSVLSRQGVFLTRSGKC